MSQDARSAARDRAATAYEPREVVHELRRMRLKDSVGGSALLTSGAARPASLTSTEQTSTEAGAVDRRGGDAPVRSDGQPHVESAATVEHGVDCTCADHGWSDGMRCAMREDWFEGNDPTDRPPPVHRYQHDPDGMAAWARARRRSILPWIRRRAHRAIQYAIYHREVALGWRRGSMTEWVLR